ncbi:hypothetical protein D3C80_1398740 [compost metagenome]
MGAEIGAGKVIVIEVLPDPVKLTCRDRQAQPQFRQRKALESALKPFILLYASTWDEPVPLRRAIGSLTQQKLPSLVFHNQIDGYQRGRTHYRGKIFLT